jgi:hypothetical protein
MVGMERHANRWGWSWWLLAGVMLAAGVYAVYLTTEATRHERAFLVQCQQIRTGATEADVEAIFGRPGMEGLSTGPPLPGCRVLSWREGKTTVSVWFDTGRRAKAIELVHDKEP